jgi:MFS family permease
MNSSNIQNEDVGAGSVRETTVDNSRPPAPRKPESARAFSPARLFADNIFYASFAFISGWLADRIPKNTLLAAGYFLAAIMAIGVMVLPLNIWNLGLIFVLGGIYVATEETLEDSLCAELVGEHQHGMAFGVLAIVNGMGDLFSSIIVGVLWGAFGTTVAFGYTAVLAIIGTLLVLRLKHS